MAQREGSTYLILFVATGLLLLGMIILYLVDHADKDTLRAKLEQEKQKLQAAQKDQQEKLKDISELHQLIGGPAASDAWPGNNEYFTNELKGKAEKAINEALADLKVTPRAYTALIQPYPDFQGLLQKLKQARDEAFAARSTANDAELKTKQSSEQMVAELKKNFDQSLKDVQDLQAKYEDLDNKAKAEKAALIAQAEKDKDECSDQIIKLNRTKNFLENQIRALESKIEKLLLESKKEQDYTEIDIDGHIVNVLGASGKAWIDLGRAQHLRNGLVFRVFQTIKGGKRQYKGKVEVQKVDESTSEVRIVEEPDNLNPIVKGDLVASPFYDPKAQPVFVFAGSELESKEVTRDYVVQKMKAYGAQIRDKVDINTDFLVAMKNFEGTPEYKTARELSVPVIRERDLLEFIGR